MIGRYDTLSLAELEADFLKVDVLADELWTADIEGRSSLELSEAVNEAGEAFSGFDANSTWLVALRCFTCNNPAPPYPTRSGVRQLSLCVQLGSPAGKSRLKPVAQQAEANQSVELLVRIKACCIAEADCAKDRTQ